MNTSKTKSALKAESRNRWRSKGYTFVEVKIPMDKKAELRELVNKWNKVYSEKNLLESDSS